MAQIDQFLKVLVQQGGSDLHLTVGAPPIMRVHGHMKPFKFRELAPKDMEQLIYEIISGPLEPLRTTGDTILDKEEIPPVNSYTIRVQQRAVLSKKAP